MVGWFDRVQVQKRTRMKKGFALLFRPKAKASFGKIRRGKAISEVADAGVRVCLRVRVMLCQITLYIVWFVVWFFSLLLSHSCSPLFS